MQSCLYKGRIGHQRYTPVRHEFKYRIFLVYLDLSELDEVFRGRWLWSTRRPTIAWFRRADHFGDPSQSLDESVRSLVQQRTGVWPTGPVRLLTHLRYFGYVMNPVSFFYCFKADGTELQNVVAEVHNTPWNERHCYVLEPHHFSRPTPSPVEKRFHVSPFMPMQMHYRWDVGVPGDELTVSLENWQDGARVFDAQLTLGRQEINAGALAACLLRYPLMTQRVMAGIYWQALKLWRKQVPYCPHPRDAEDQGDDDLHRESQRGDNSKERSNERTTT